MASEQSRRTHSLAASSAHAKSPAPRRSLASDCRAARHGTAFGLLENSLRSRSEQGHVNNTHVAGEHVPHQVLPLSRSDSSGDCDKSSGSAGRSSGSASSEMPWQVRTEGSASNARREQHFNYHSLWLRESANVHRDASTTVRVKNTFIHIEDVTPPLQRSRSTSDVSSGPPSSGSTSGSSDRQAMLMNLQGSDHTPHGVPTHGGLFMATIAPPTDAFEDIVRSRRSGAGYVGSASASSQKHSPPWRTDNEGFVRTPGGASSGHVGPTSSACSSAPGLGPLPDVASSADRTATSSSFPPDVGDASAEAKQDQGTEGNWSVGSAKHEQGECSPCRFHQSPKGCNNGSSCVFCHMPHAAQQRKRPFKAQRARCKELVGFLNNPRLDNRHGHRTTGDLRVDLANTCASDAEKVYLQELVKASRAGNQDAHAQQRDDSAGSGAYGDPQHQPAQYKKMSL